MSKITYIMGYGRSGSTFYESHLQNSKAMNGFGEIKYLAERGLLKNELCSCGIKAKECPFWKNIISEMGDWNLAEVSRVTDKLESSKMFFLNALIAKLGGFKSDISLYQGFNDRLFDLLGSHGDFIDSSKMPARVYFLSLDRNCPFQNIVWFIRDPRGVAWSCMKDIERPEAQHKQDAKMPRFGYFPSIIKWIINSITARYVANLFADRTCVKRYETIAEELEEASRAEAKSRPERIIGKATSFHSISGNPRRFTGGFLVFRMDDEWKHKLSLWQKFFAKLLCAFILKSIQNFERLGQRST